MNCKGDYYCILHEYAVYIFFITVFFISVRPTVSYASMMSKKESISISTDTVKTGIVNFRTTADTIYIYVDRNYDRLVTLTTDKQLILKRGIHRVFVFGKNFPEHEYYLDLIAYKTITLTLPAPKNFQDSWESNRSAYASLQWNANLIVETDRETSVWIDNKLVGEGFIKQTLPAGTYLLSFRRTHGEKIKNSFVTIHKRRLSYVKYFFLPSETVAKRYVFLPGVSQLYKHQYLKSGALMLTTALTTVLGVSSNTKFNSRKSEYYRVRKEYQMTTDEQLALKYGNQLDELAGSTKKYQRRRNFFLIAAGVLYVLNIYDGFQRPQSGYRRNDILNPFEHFRVNILDKNLSLAFNIRF